jgi:hypothetical protein
MPGDTVGPLQVREDPSGSALVADVRDISIQGIGLLIDRSLRAGTSLLIVGGPSGNAHDIQLTAAVCHATLLENGRWLIGCIFPRLLTADDFEVLS